MLNVQLHLLACENLHNTLYAQRFYVSLQQRNHLEYMDRADLVSDEASEEVSDEVREMIRLS